MKRKLLAPFPEPGDGATRTVAAGVVENVNLLTLILINQNYEKNFTQLALPGARLMQHGTDALCTVGNYFTDCHAVMVAAAASRHEPM